MTLSRKILIGLGAGVATGLVLGDLVAPLRIVADGYRGDLSRHPRCREPHSIWALLLMASRDRSVDLARPTSAATDVVFAADSGPSM